MSKIARLHIRRGTKDTPARSELFEVPFEPGQSLLDGLRWIRIHKDPSLALRYSCINANACKECMLEVDGEVGYACTERLREGDMQLAPLANKALVQDLVTDISPRDERLPDQS